MEVLYKKRNDDFIWKQIWTKPRKCFLSIPGICIFLDSASSVSKVAREIQSKIGLKG